MNSLPLIVSSVECIQSCLTKLTLFTISFKPRHSNYIQPYLAVLEIASKVNAYNTTKDTTLLLEDLAQLSMFHSINDISLLLSSIKAKQIIVLCSNESLFSSMQCSFTQAIEGTTDSYTVYSTLTKKSRVVMKVNKEKEDIQNVVEAKEDRDIMTIKQIQTKNNTALPFEKIVLRFGDDSDVSEFSDDDDLAV